MASTSYEITWLKFLLADLQVPHLQLALLFYDNKATLHSVANPVFHERIEHIELDCHLVREKIQVRLNRTLYIRSKHQLADLFIKSLGFGQFKFLLSKMNILNIFCSS